MKSNNEILKWLKQMVEKYSELTFKYEYCNKLKTHYISVFPKELISSSEEYCDDENDIYDELSKKYPEESFLFGTEEENFKLSENAIKIEYIPITNEYNYSISLGDIGPATNLFDDLRNRITSFNKSSISVNEEKYSNYKELAF